MHYRPYILLTLVCCPWLAFLCIQHFWIRDRIPTIYKDRLATLLAQYEKQSASDRINTAQQIEVCFNRLSAVGQSQAAGLQELEFFTSHLKWLQAFNDDAIEPIASSITDQTTRYEGVVADLLAKLVRSSDTKVRRSAYLVLADKYLIGESTQNDKEIIDVLTEFLQQDQSDDSTRLLLAEMLLEAAWRSQYKSLILIPDSNSLERSRKVAELLPVGSPKREQLLARIDIFLNPRAIVSSSGILLKDAESRIVSSILKASWDEVQWELNSLNQHQKEKLSKWVGLEITRTLLSDFADSNNSWAEHAAIGLQFAAALRLDSPEFQSLLWQLAMQHAELTGSRVSKSLLESVLLRDRGELKYPILIYSSLQKGNTTSAQKYLELALQINPKVAELVSLQSVWYVQRDDQFLSPWSELIQYLRAKAPKSGAAHIAACFIAIEQENWPQARVALREAREILGEVPAVAALTRQLEQAPSN